MKSAATGYRVFDLAHLGLITVTGTDARDFLSAQLTSDLRSLNEGMSQRSAWCTGQGRVIATLRIVQHDRGYVLVLARDLLDDVRRRLSLYVLRAQVRIDAAADRPALIGIRGTPAALAGFALPRSADAQTTAGALTIVRCDGDSDRALVIGPAGEVGALFERARGDACLLDATDWRALDIAGGHAHVCAATSELFVPQMLDLDRIGAVSFDKGCYPGQEIIARLKYRGEVKRRLRRGALDGPTIPEPGAELGAPTDARDEAAGHVVDAVCTADGTAQMLAVTRNDSAGQRLWIDATTSVLTERRSDDPLP
ncbi:MAG: folate-binding protein YgfZ [Gammaproteobacteria bacterium]|nr:folate-binding protein YgfZ [Gammaproteobacteria bacterium]